MIDTAGILLRLTAACVLGGAIGMQREGANRPAGFRTHVLVALGSSLIMLISAHGFGDVGRIQDPARIAAQVVSGIGFLGAGTIMKAGSSIKGLTTAASLWVVAGIGLACGAGFYVGAVASTILVYVVLTTFSKVERYVFHRAQYLSLEITIKDTPGQLGQIGAVLGMYGVSIRNISLNRTDEEVEHVEVHVEVKMPGNITAEVLLDKLASMPDVLKIDYA